MVTVRLFVHLVTAGGTGPLTLGQLGGYELGEQGCSIPVLATSAAYSSAWTARGGRGVGQSLLRRPAVRARA